MNRAVRILLYLVGIFTTLIGLASFGQGLFVPSIVAMPYLFIGILFFIGGIIVIWLAARTRKVKAVGVWRLTN